MKKLIVAWALLGLMFAIGTPVANAVYTAGTPSPTLSPVFGTLVNFDDQATGTPVLWNDYVSVGVASITEQTGAGAAFARYAGTQSMPNYVGTGAYEIGGPSGRGWDGTIWIDLALPASQIGIGVANNQGGPEFLSVYNIGGNLLESYQVLAGGNVYAVITRPAYDISRIQITGDFFAIDDLQFNAIPAPGAILLGSIGVAFVGWLRRRRTL
jgi:hypothetical protein